MEEDFNFKIYEPPSDRRYWVVKADAGKFYEIFTDNSLIAIGHLNEFVSERHYSSPFVFSSDNIRRAMTRLRGNKEYYNSNNYGQVNSFVNEMKRGDWVLTKGNGVIRVGRIESDAMLDNDVSTAIVNEGTRYEKIVEMDFMLKRDVCWGPIVNIDHLPIDIFLSLKSPMTLYNIDRYMESICYCIYPYFKINNSLHFSIRINQKDELRNFYITKIFEYLNELEFLSKIDQDSMSDCDLADLYHELAISEGFNLSTQASFHSPGDIWAKLGFSGTSVTSKMMYAVLVYAMLFGNTHLGVDGVLDLESRKKMWEVLIKRIDMDVTKEAVAKLELGMPNYDTKEIEKEIADTTENERHNKTHQD